MIEKSDIISAGSGSPININWELVSHCQFNCSYCYYRPFQSDTDYVPLSKIILHKLQTITEPTKVSLIGGEPTLHPSFEEVLNSLFAMPHIEQICVVTNFIKPLEFWKKLLPFKSKLKISASFHPEYEQRDFVQKLAELQKDFLVDLVFIVHNDEMYLSRMKKAASDMDLLDRTKVSINFVPIHDNRVYRTYPKPIQDFMSAEQEKTRFFEITEKLELNTRKGKVSLPKFEVINQKLNQFEGWSCKLRAFIIHENGMVSSACNSKKKHILLSDFKVTELICPYKICECDDYWNFEKKFLSN